MSLTKLDTSFPLLRTSMDRSYVQRMATVLQAGFFRQSTQGTTLFSFLNSLPGFSEDYTSSRLQTIFLNGDPVDDTDLTFSAETAVLALSAEMPGLAGSIFRKSGILNSLRTSAVQQQLHKSGAPVVVQVKYFNVIGLEKGAALLDRGAVLDCKDLLSFLELRPSLIEAMVDTTLDGKPISPRDYLPQLSYHSKLFFICNATDV